MPRKPKTQEPEPTPDQLADTFRSGLIETTRRSIAMRRHFHGAKVRWRRAARTGPNAAFALLCVIRPGQAPAVEVWPYQRIDELASSVTDDEVNSDLLRNVEVEA